MDKKFIKLINILEDMADTSKLLTEEIYGSLDFTNSNFSNYADKFRDISFKLFKLEEIIKKEM